MPEAALLPFLVSTFGLAWGILALFLLFPQRAEEVFGTLSGHHPLLVIAVYAPAIAALAVVWHQAGLAPGLRSAREPLLGTRSAKHFGPKC